MSKNNVVNSKAKSKKWENPKVVSTEPLKDKKIRDFVAETEGRHGGGHDPRARQAIKTSLSEKEARKQSETLDIFTKKVR